MVQFASQILQKYAARPIADSAIEIDPFKPRATNHRQLAHQALPTSDLITYTKWCMFWSLAGWGTEALRTEKLRF